MPITLSNHGPPPPPRGQAPPRWRALPNEDGAAHRRHVIGFERVEGTGTAIAARAAGRRVGFPSPREDLDVRAP